MRYMTDPECTTPQPVSFRWDPAFVALIDAARGDVPRSAFVRAAVMDGIAATRNAKAKPPAAQPAAPRVGKLIDTATGHETPVVQGATVTSADLIVKEASAMCHTCRKSGPPRSGRPCPSCGTTGPKVRQVRRENPYETAPKLATAPRTIPNQKGSAT